uniref:Uncharacterized protein n=1 Tax=Eutreptiella gymnastica TaxID=73025 RepID=A0A7S4CMM8_9EUGL
MMIKGASCRCCLKGAGRGSIRRSLGRLRAQCTLWGEHARCTGYAGGERGWGRSRPQPTWTTGAVATTKREGDGDRAPAESRDSIDPAAEQEGPSAQPQSS